MGIYLTNQIFLQICTVQATTLTVYSKVLYCVSGLFWRVYFEEYELRTVWKETKWSK